MSEVKEPSAVTLKETNGGKVLEVQLTGKLAREDYAQFVPVTERLVQAHGKVRLLVEMHDFHGWTTGALWQDLKFDVKHFRDIDRIAMVGETKWQHGMAVFCKPFTTARVRYFERSRRYMEAPSGRDVMHEGRGHVSRITSHSSLFPHSGGCLFHRSGRI